METASTIKALGIIGSLGVGISLFPQTYKTWKEKDISSISVTYIYITSISSILMVIYGTYFLVYPMIIANLSVFGNTCVLLLFYYKTKYTCSIMMEV
tara:strand:+ start:1623 stop:1913 length:291 start_codon:yes stop_codon:yes gene_type:complete